MKKKPIDKIRITEICRLAQIERSTFYYHFNDKYELVAWIFFQAADSTNIIDVHEVAEGMKQMKNDMLFYKRAYEDTSQNALWQYMLECSAEVIVQMMFNSMPEDLKHIYFGRGA